MVVPFERAIIAMIVSYRLAVHCDHCAISNHSAANCDVSDAQINRGWVTLEQHLERKGIPKPDFNTIWERHGTVVCKRNLVDIFCRLSTMHERDGQTNR